MLRILRNISVAHSRTFVSTSKTAVAPNSRQQIDSALFDDVQSRLRQSGNTLEKVIVTFVNRDGTKKDYLMNRNTSTPYDCARHVNMLVAKRAVLALTMYGEGETRVGCMNEPLLGKCDLEVLDFQSEKYVEEVNKAYWRSCSVLLAAVLTEGLRDKISSIGLHNDVPDSYFGVDFVGLATSLSNADLRDLTLFARSEFISRSTLFETVTLTPQLAHDYGLESSVKLCRLGNFVTPVDGPVISRSDQIGRFTIVKGIVKGEHAFVGGVSLPFDQKSSSFLWEKIVENAKDKIDQKKLLAISGV